MVIFYQSQFRGHPAGVKITHFLVQKKKDPSYNREHESNFDLGTCNPQKTSEYRMNYNKYIVHTKPDKVKLERTINKLLQERSSSYLSGFSLFKKRHKKGNKSEGKNKTIELNGNKGINEPETYNETDGSLNMYLVANKNQYIKVNNIPIFRDCIIRFANNKDSRNSI